jgi:tRNA nucleotidyltransferase (CCA-adding enzyme)
VITDPDEVIPTQHVTIARQAPDDELLLVDWLNALVYEMATRKMLFGRFEVHFNDHSLHATAWGESVEVTRHRPAVEVKGRPIRISSLSRARRGTGSRSAWWMYSPSPL